MQPTNQVRVHVNAFGAPFSARWSSTVDSPRASSILPLHIVESRYVKRLLPFIGNFAYLALASGFVMTDILTLRIMLVGGYSGLVLFHLLHPRPLRIPLRWSALFVAVNAAMTAKLVYELWPPGLSEDELVMRDAFFERLTPAQFKALLDLGERRVLRDGVRITTEREACRCLYFVESGVADLSVDNELVATIGRGGFINDVAFQQGSGSGAYGTVVAHGEMHLIAWDMALLRQELVKDAPLNSAFQQVVVGSLVDQLLQRYKAQQYEDEQQRLNTGSERLRKSTTSNRFRESFEMARVRARNVELTASSPASGDYPKK